MIFYFFQFAFLANYCIFTHEYPNCPEGYKGVDLSVLPQTVFSTKSNVIYTTFDSNASGKNLTLYTQHYQDKELKIVGYPAYIEFHGSNHIKVKSLFALYGSSPVFDGSKTYYFEEIGLTTRPILTNHLNRIVINKMIATQEVIHYLFIEKGQIAPIDISFLLDDSTTHILLTEDNITLIDKRGVYYIDDTPYNQVSLTILEPQNCVSFDAELNIQKRKVITLKCPTSITVFFPGKNTNISDDYIPYLMRVVEGKNVKALFERSNFDFSKIIDLKASMNRNAPLFNCVHKYYPSSNASQLKELGSFLIDRPELFGLLFTNSISRPKRIKATFYCEHKEMENLTWSLKYFAQKGIEMVIYSKINNITIKPYNNWISLMDGNFTINYDINCSLNSAFFSPYTIVSFQSIDGSSLYIRNLLIESPTVEVFGSPISIDNLTCSRSLFFNFSKHINGKTFANIACDEIVNSLEYDIDFLRVTFINEVLKFTYEKLTGLHLKFLKGQDGHIIRFSLTSSTSNELSFMPNITFAVSKMNVILDETWYMIRAPTGLFPAIINSNQAICVKVPSRLSIPKDLLRFTNGVGTPTKKAHYCITDSTDSYDDCNIDELLVPHTQSLLIRYKSVESRVHISIATDVKLSMKLISASKIIIQSKSNNFYTVDLLCTSDTIKEIEIHNINLKLINKADKITFSAITALDNARIEVPLNMQMECSKIYATVESLFSFIDSLPDSDIRNISLKIINYRDRKFSGHISPANYMQTGLPNIEILSDSIMLQTRNQYKQLFFSKYQKLEANISSFVMIGNGIPPGGKVVRSINLNLFEKSKLKFVNFDNTGVIFDANFRRGKIHNFYDTIIDYDNTSDIFLFFKESKGRWRNTIIKNIICIGISDYENDFPEECSTKIFADENPNISAVDTVQSPLIYLLNITKKHHVFFNTTRWRGYQELTIKSLGTHGYFEISNETKSNLIIKLSNTTMIVNNENISFHYISLERNSYVKGNVSVFRYHGSVKSLWCNNLSVSFEEIVTLNVKGGDTIDAVFTNNSYTFKNHNYSTNVKTKFVFISTKLNNKPIKLNFRFTHKGFVGELPRFAFSNPANVHVNISTCIEGTIVFGSKLYIYNPKPGTIKLLNLPSHLKGLIKFDYKKEENNLTSICLVHKDDSINHVCTGGKIINYGNDEITYSSLGLQGTKTIKINIYDYRNVMPTFGNMKSAELIISASSRKQGVFIKNGMERLVLYSVSANIVGNVHFNSLILVGECKIAGNPFTYEMLNISEESQEVLKIIQKSQNCATKILMKVSGLESVHISPSEVRLSTDKQEFIFNNTITDILEFKTHSSSNVTFYYSNHNNHTLPIAPSLSFDGHANITFDRSFADPAISSLRTGTIEAQSASVFGSTENIPYIYLIQSKYTYKQINITQ